MYKNFWISEKPSCANIQLFEEDICESEIAKSSFTLCSLFNFRRVLCERLWEPFIKIIQENQKLYQDIQNSIGKLTIIKKIDIVKFLGGGYGNREYDWLDFGSIIHLYNNLNENLIHILQIAIKNDIKMFVRRNDDIYKIFGLTEYDINNDYSYSFISDISLKFPTGFLHLVRMIPFKDAYNGDAMHLFNIFYPDITDSKLLEKVNKTEPCALRPVHTLKSIIFKREYDVLVNSNTCLFDVLVNIIVNYSLDDFQLVCRYIEWENEIFTVKF